MALSPIRLLAGVTLILFVIVANIVTAFIVQGTSSGVTSAFCDTDDNVTECEDVGKTSFFAVLLSVSFGLITDGSNGFEVAINVFWGTVVGVLLTTGILLIALSFVPTTSA